MLKMNDDPNRAAALTDVLIDTLYLDLTYQRDPSTRLIDKIAKHWNLRAANVLTVNLRTDGVIAVIDGNHRRCAALAIGLRSLPAYTHYGINVQEESELFLLLNRDRLAHTAVGKWKAELRADNPLVHDLDDVVRACGFYVGKRGRIAGADPRVINSPDTLLRIVGEGRIVSAPDYEHVRDTLTFLREAWPDQPEATSQLMILGVSAFLRRYYASLTSVRDAKQKLGMEPASRHIAVGKSISYGESVRPVPGMVRALQRAYNKGRRSNRLDEVGKL